MYMLLGDLPPHISPLPPKEELLQQYCSAVSRPYPIERWETCEAWAWFRNAVISQGIAARVAQRQASSAEAKLYATKFPAASDAVRTIIKRAESNGNGKRGSESDAEAEVKAKL
jgi:hypothetical protein